MMKTLINIENKFKEITLLSQATDLSIYPITEHTGFEIRMNEKKEHGEVFTPIELVDKMIEISKPEPDKLNMDLCAGHGQFTIRILRKFVNENKNFNIYSYLQKYHWFNEYNIDSSLKLLYIFGENINLCVGPAQELKSMPTDINGFWLKGVFYWDQLLNRWSSKDIEELEALYNIQQPNKKESSSKALF